jgi:hypothetical protein
VKNHHRALHLEPEFHPGDQGDGVGVAAAGFDAVGGIAEGGLPAHPNVGGELATDLVAQPEAELDAGEARADIILVDILRGDFEFHPGLQAEALRQQNVVFGLNTKREVSVFAEEEVGVDLEPIVC